MKKSVFAFAALVAAMLTAGPIPTDVVPGGAVKSKAPYKLGMAGYTFHKKNLDDTLKVLQAVGVHNLCVKDFHLKLDASQAEVDEFKAKLAAAGVVPYAVGPVYASDEATARKAFECAKKLGVKIVVGVPNEKDPNTKKNVESEKMLDVIEKLVKEYDMCYAIHNHGPDMPELYPTAEAIMKRIANRDKRIGLCLDIGHEFRFGYNPCDTIRRYKDRIYDVHLKNVSAPSKKGGAMPLPRGAMDLVEIARALAEVNYQGWLGLEYERDFEANELGVAESIGYFRGVMDSIR